MIVEKLFRTTMQAYLALGSELDAFIDNLGLEGVEAERIRFAVSLLREAMPPTARYQSGATATGGPREVPECGTRWGERAARLEGPG